MAVLNTFAQGCTESQLLGIKPWWQFVPRISTDGYCTLNFEKFGVGTVWLVLAGIIDILLRIGLFVSIGFFIYGAFRMVTSQGSPDQVKAARGTMVNSLIGLIICITSIGMVSFVLGTILK